jgi:hypothetical protein
MLISFQSVFVALLKKTMEGFYMSRRGNLLFPGFYVVRAVLISARNFAEKEWSK